MGRDPRVEPRAGDVVRRNIGGDAKVVRERNGCVEYQERGSPEWEWRQRPYQCFIAEWRSEHRASTAIHVAEG